ncbi:MAG: hypothetical protein ACJ76L_07690 [Conexibacter sp.]
MGRDPDAHTSRPLRARRRNRAILGAAALVALLLAIVTAAGGVGSSTDPRQTATLSVQPFAPTLGADATGDAHHLWVAAYGRSAAGIGVVIYHHNRRGDWTPHPEQLPAPVDEDSPVSLTLNQDEPCIGYNVNQAPVVYCRHRTWSKLRGIEAGRRMRLVELTSCQSVLYALLADATSGSLAVWQHSPSSRWTPTGNNLPIRAAIGHFVANAAGRCPGVNVATQSSIRGQTTRAIWSRARTGWKQTSQLPAAAMGPFLSGPIQLRDGTLAFPIVTASSRPWRFSVLTKRRGSAWQPANPRPLNTGPGDAQGVLAASQAATWAIWQQNAVNTSGTFATRILVAAIHTPDLSIGRPRELWSGTSIGPAPVDVVHALGRDWALYLPAASTTTPELRVVVRPLTG